MMERAQVRCPVCKSVVPAMLLWALGDACPRCHWVFGVGGPRPDSTNRRLQASAGAAGSATPIIESRVTNAAS
jgi:hypothetical protein